MNVLGLVQLCEISQGVGGYSHTFGIEQLARSGRLKNAEQLSELVQGVLRARIGPTDGVASGIAFRAARQSAFERLPGLCAAMSSERVPMPMQLASLQMGQRLWGVSRGWEWATAVHAQFDEMAGRTDMHHAVAYGALVSETTSSQVRAIATYLFNTARSLILAAVRTIPLDEMTGQRVLSQVQPAISEMAAAFADKEVGEIIGLRGGGELPVMFP